MTLIRSILLTGLGLACSTTTLYAADYYISPRQAGPVVGAPLAAVSLQSTTEGGEVTEPSRLQTNIMQTERTAGKWVRVEKKTTTTTTTTTPTTTTTTTAPTTTTTTTAPTTTTTTGTTTTTTTATPTTTTTTTASSPTIAGLAPLAKPVSGPTYQSFGALVSARVLQAGDRVFLMGGYHGPMTVDGLKFTAPVTIAQMPGQVAHVESISVLNSANITFRDLKVWDVTPHPGNVPLIRTYPSSSDITFGNLDIRSVPNSTQYANWTTQDWMSNYRTGMYLDGARQKAIGNRLTGIYHGIQTAGQANVIAYNIIDGFAADGMRALGNDAIVKNNKVQNCFQIDANHADGLQSWSVGPTGTPGTGTVKNMTVENNKILEWTLPSTSAMRCKLQGIGMFDGMYENFKISNNLIVVSGYHGIAVAGGINVSITQNTVANAYGQAAQYPWIKTGPHKNGTFSWHLRVANNTANSIQSFSKPERDNLATNNVAVTNFSAEFTAPSSFDFSLRSTAKSANAGMQTYATPVDIAGTPRPRGTSADCGAYESQ